MVAVGNLTAYTPRRSADTVADQHGLEEAIKLSSNESAFGPLPSVVEAISRATTEVHRYPDSTCTALRTALGHRLGVDPSHLYVGAGSAADAL